MLNQEKNNNFVIVFLLSLAFLLRICFVPHFIGGWDSVDFALGLREYDISKYQPHFPGYPVYMLFAKLLFLFLKNEVFSLTLTSAIFGSLTILPFYYLCSDLYGRHTALLASLLLIINPMHWLLSTKALSDIMGLFFIVFSTFLLYRAVITKAQKSKIKFLTLASLILGTGLGVRISYFPHLILLGLVVLVCYRQVSTGRDKVKILVYPFLAFIGSLLTWFLGQSIISGYNTLINEGMIFLNGHFTEWGGTIFTHPNIVERIKELLIQNILIHGLGGGGSLLRLWVTLLSVISILFYLCKEPFNFKKTFLIFWGLPYLLWVLYAQNLNNPRHILATVPVLLLIISRGFILISDFLCKNKVVEFPLRTQIKTGAHYKTIENLSFILVSLRKFLTNSIPLKKAYASYLLILTLLGSLFSISFNIVSVHAQEKSAMLKLVNFVQKKYDPTETIIFCWETKRLFDYYAPEFITVRENGQEIEGSIAFHFYGKPKIILITSDMVDRWGLKGKKLKQKINLIKHFYHNPYTQNAYHSIYLYQFDWSDYEKI